MNYFSTHTYDNQTLRWFVPDPAMQFSNPYLGIANNPVNYVDPDGEFAIIADLIIAKKIAAKVAIGAKVAGAYAKAGMKIAGTVGKFAGQKVGAAAAKSASNWDSNNSKR
jgi:hypothetical protein